MSISKKAFTLIELLVVIAIISLLVSMLLPALKTAKELARRAACSANLHSIGASIHLYASDWDGFLPLHANNIYSSTLVGPGLAMTAPWRTYAAYWAGWADSLNLAGLYEEKYTDTPSIFYCPSQNDNYAYDTFKNIWALPTNAERRSKSVRTSYCYNPYAGIQWARLYTNFADMPMNKPLTLDIPLSRESTAHRDAPGWNVMFPDSSVRFIQSTTVWDILINSAEASWWTGGCSEIINTLSEE